MSGDRAGEAAAAACGGDQVAALRGAEGVIPPVVPEAPRPVADG